MLTLLMLACTIEDAAKDDTADTADTADTGDTGENERLLVATATEGDTTVEIWSDVALHVGLNAMDYRVLDAAGAAVDDLTVLQAPLMVMEDSSHACPYTTPVGVGDGWYTSEVVFQMAGDWEDSVTVDAEEAMSFGFSALSVAETGLAQMVMAGAETWVLTLNFATDPIVGENPFILTVHSKQNMMSFPEVAGLTATVTPWMPDMGHGSDGNVDPVYTADGRYEGVAVFSMMGAWELGFALDNGAGTTTEVTFELEI